MSKLQVTIAAIAMGIIGIIALFNTPETATIELTPIVAELVEPESPMSVHPLERARQSVFDLIFDKQARHGSAILVGRKRLDDNKYLYRALTAHHVAETTLDDEERDLSVTLTFQPYFHGDALQVQLLLDDIDWAVPTLDWASFTFQLDTKLDCVEIATELEFMSIQAFDPIHMVACKGSYAQQCSTGVIAVTHNYRTDFEKQCRNRAPCHQKPHSFFKVSMPGWYGDSGGAIFSDEGKLIGIVTSFTIFDKYEDALITSLACLKTHRILEIIEEIPEFTLVED